MYSYISIRPEDRLPLPLQRLAAGLPHLTVIHPFNAIIGTDEFYPLKWLTDIAREIAGEVDPFSIHLNSIRVHPNAAKSSWVVSLKVAKSVRLELIRAHFTRQLREAIDRRLLFPFHIILAKNLSRGEANKLRRQLLADFQPTSLRVRRLSVMWRPSNDVPWRVCGEYFLRSQTG